MACNHYVHLSGPMRLRPGEQRTPFVPPISLMPRPIRLKK